MILKRYRRDAALPELLGDRELAPPRPEAVLSWAEELLLEPGASAPRSATWEFARWKPGVSITCLYALELADGGSALVALKRYASAKARHLAARARAALPGTPAGPPPRPRGRAFADEHTLLWTPSADRLLPGLARLLDPRRPARWLEEVGAVPERSVRRRRTVCELVRYKPERRAVARLDLSLRAGPDRHKSFAARVLPPAEARRVDAARRALAAADPSAPVVPLALEQAAIGILFEPWLDVATFADGCFDHAEAAGRALARLHRVPLAGPDSPPARDEGADAGGARALLARLHLDASAIPAPADEPRSWVHGDLHPDQVALARSGEPLLLDLDRLGRGDPRRDLASWIADRLASEPGAELEEAAGPLLAGYRAEGGAGCEAHELAGFVADELVRRAAAALRRLEHGALERARTLVVRARELAVQKPAAAAGARSGLDDALAALARLCRDQDAPARVSRADVSRDGELFLTVEHEGGERWFRWAAGEVESLDPARDAALPLAARLRAGDRERVLSWRPGRRIVLRAGDRILKGHRPKRLGDAVRAHSHGAAVNAAGGFRVPALDHVSGPESALSLELLAGEALRPTERAAAFFRTAAVRLRAMQEASTAGLAPFGPQDELLVLERWRERLASVAVPLPAGWTRVAQDAALAAALLPEAARVPCHRDLHDKQLLVTSLGLALLDFDLLCAADPALDPGNLLAHLRLRALQRAGGADEPGARSCRAAFLEGLGRPEENDLDAALRFYQGTTYLRLSLVYSLRPRWRGLAPVLLRLADLELADAPTRVRP